VLSLRRIFMSESRVTPAELERAIRNVPDFPKPGIQF